MTQNIVFFMFDFSRCRHYYDDMNEWLEVLQNESLPLNCSLRFNWQNGNIQRVSLNGKQVAFSKSARKFARSWIGRYRWNGPLARMQEAQIPIDVEFHNVQAIMDTE
jgi:hypothetical protein